MLKNTNTKGFTLVELLIVIVVIAILAAISIVAYNGIQNRGKNTAAQSLASQVIKKAEAFNTIDSNYPANAADFATVTEATLDGLSVNSTNSIAAPADEKSVNYSPCPTTATGNNATGARVTYRTFPSGAAAFYTAGTGCPTS